MQKLLPSDLSIKANAIEVPEVEYNFPEQVKNHPMQAGYYTYNSMQTYDWNGNPSDTRGDNWD